MRNFFSLLLAGLLVACSSTPDLREPTELQSIKTGIKVNELWSASTPTSSNDKIYEQLYPALYEGVLYIVAAKGVVQAHEIGQGKKLWTQELETPVSGGLGVSQDLLVMGTSEAEVIALGRIDGEIRWRSKVSSEVLAPPVLTDTIVIVRCGNGVTHALNAETGEQLWRFSSQTPALSLRGEAAPVISGDLVLLGLANGRLAALSIFDGVVQWESTVIVPKGRTDLERMVDVDATPVVVGDVVYVAAHQGRVVALSRLSGTLLWSHDLGTSVGLAIDAENVYVADDDGQVWALDRRNGATLWKLEKLKFRDLTAPVVYEDAVVVGDFEGYLHWLSKTDGSIIARYQVDEDGLRVPPLVRDGVLYSRSKIGYIEALRLRH